MSSPFCKLGGPSCAWLGPLTVRSHLSEGMWIATICHTEMVGKLTALQEAVASATQSMLGHLPIEAFWVDVVVGPHQVLHIRYGPTFWLALAKVGHCVPSWLVALMMSLARA
jgi:hypothetical protein